MIITVNRVPDSPNVLRRKYRHPQAYRRLRKRWEKDLYYGAGSVWVQQGLRIAAKEGKMRVQVSIFHRKLFDADNLVGSLKPILDALKNIGFIQSDSAEHLVLEPTTQLLSQDVRTTVHIAPVETLAEYEARKT